jgi:hypothetical protein
MRKVLAASAAAAMVMGVAGTAAAQCNWSEVSMAEKSTPVPAPVETAEAPETTVDPALLLPTEVEEKDEG